jgi:hypothetical protein
MLQVDMHDDEPVLILRASEAITPTILSVAIHYYKLNGYPEQIILSLTELEQAMEEWRGKNPEKIFRIGCENEKQGQEQESDSETSLRNDSSGL